MPCTKVCFISGCAVESDIVYLATQLEDVDSTEYAHTRMSAYVGRNDTFWSLAKFADKMDLGTTKNCLPTTDTEPA